MPTLEAYSDVSLFSNGRYLPPRDPSTGSLSNFYTLYGLATGGLLWSHLEADHFDNLLRLAGIAKNIICDISSLKADIATNNYFSAVGDSKDLYRDANAFIDSFGGSKKADAGTTFALTYPAVVTYGEIDAIELRFWARAEDDDITTYSLPHVGAQTPGLSLTVPPQYRTEGWDNNQDLTYHIDLPVLVAALGDGIYGDGIYAPDGITFLFGVGIKSTSVPLFGVGDMAIRHAITLTFKRPSPPTFLMQPVSGRAGTLVTLHGENLAFAREVTLDGHPVPWAGPPSDTDITFSVPDGDGAAMPVRVATPGGVAVEDSFTRYGPIHSLTARQHELQAGDVLELEIGCVDEITQVTFVGRSGLPEKPLPPAGLNNRFADTGGPIQYASGHEFPATWRMGPYMPRGEFDTFEKRLIYVGVPSNLPERLEVRVSTRGYERTIGALIYVPGAPEITSVRGPARLRLRDLTVFGRNLEYSPQVTFGGSDAVVLSIEDESIRFAAPPGVDGGRIQVTTPYGVATTPYEFQLGTERSTVPND